MSGLDKIKSQILDEANHSAEAKIAEANERAERMIREAKAEAEAEAFKQAQKSQEAVKTYAERIQSSGDMQRRKAILQAKQELIAGVLEKAYERICLLETAAYFEMIEKMLDKYVQPSDGVIYFNEADLKRMPQGFEAKMKKIAESKRGFLALAKEPKAMDGGFVLVYGGIEENCTIRAMFDAKRDELSDQVQGVLF